MVGEMSEQPAPDRSHDKAYGKQDRGIELLYDGIFTRKERTREVEREGGVGVEIIPLHQVANRADENGLEPSAHVGSLVEMILAKGGRCRRHLCRSSWEACGKPTTPPNHGCFSRRGQASLRAARLRPRKKRKSARRRPQG